MHCQRAGTLVPFRSISRPPIPTYDLPANPIQNESVLIQKIYTTFKKAPGTHKLGVLYVVDSVTRQWVEAARKSGQDPRADAPDGTFAAGVKRVTDLLPVLMTDIINNAPQDQKVRNRKHQVSINHLLQFRRWDQVILAPFRISYGVPLRSTLFILKNSPHPLYRIIADVTCFILGQDQEVG